MWQSALIGLVQSGGAYALLAVCVILMYRTTGVLNFALAAIGVAGTYAFSSFYTSGMNLAEAAIFGILIGAAASVVCGLIYIRWFFDATPTYRAGVAIALLVGTAAVTIRIFSDQPREIPALIPGSGFAVDGVVMTPTTIFGIALAIVFTLLVTQMLHRTRRASDRAARRRRLITRRRDIGHADREVTKRAAHLVFLDAVVVG